MSASSPPMQQTVVGNNNIFSMTGDVYVIKKPAEIPASEAQTRRDLGILLDRVETFWIKGVLDQSIHQASLIDLAKQSAPGAVDRPWESILEVPDAASQTLPRGTDILSVFDQANGALLILGEPGSGKTISLLELARGLVALARNDQDWGHPVPVVLNLSSWSGQRGLLVDWMVGELTSRYQIPKKIGRDWITDHRILPLLDGLDEVQEEHRAECVTAINRFAADVGLAGLAVCCRLAEYAQLPTKLKLNAAIRLSPLNAAQVDAYLADAGPKLAPLRGLIKTDKGLADLAESPLMLSVMSATYQDVPADELAQASAGGAAQQRARLFNAYIAKMFTRHGDGPQPFTREQTLGWLTWLAQQMTARSTSVFLIEQLEPDWLANRRAELAYTFVSRGLAGALLGIGWALLAFAILGISDLTSLLVLFVSLPLGLGIISGLGAGLGVAYLSGSQEPRAQGSVNRKRFLLNLVFWLLIGLIPAVAISSNPAVDPMWFNDLLALALVPAVLYAWRASRREWSNDIVPAESLRWSWREALLLGLAAFAAAAFVSTLIYLLQQNQLSDALTDGLIDGAFFGSIGLVFGGFKSGVMQGTTQPNQGIRLSIRNSVLAAVIAGCLLTVVTLLLYVVMAILFPSDQSWFWNVMSSLGYGVATAAIVGLWLGGMDVIQHYVLRRLLVREQHAPWKYSSFLDYASDRIFLRKVGGGYIFVHRLLMEHFAAMDKR